MDISKPFSEEEIKATVWGLGPDKPPVLDGFSIFFFLSSFLGLSEARSHQIDEMPLRKVSPAK